MYTYTDWPKGCAMSFQAKIWSVQGCKSHEDMYVLYATSSFQAQPLAFPPTDTLRPQPSSQRAQHARLQMQNCSDFAALVSHSEYQAHVGLQRSEGVKRTIWQQQVESSIRCLASALCTDKRPWKGTAGVQHCRSNRVAVSDAKLAARAAECSNTLRHRDWQKLWESPVAKLAVREAR